MPVERITEAQAASQIDALLATEPEYAEEKPEKESKAPETKAEEAEEAEEVKESDEEEPEEESESDDEELEIDFDDPMFEVEKGRKVSLNQLKQEHMLQSDYTKKTQELAKQRAEVQEELSKGINKQRHEYLTALENTQQLMLTLMAPETQDLDRLAEEDPAEYVRAQNKRNKIQEAWRQIEEAKSSEVQKHQEYIRTNVLPKELELTKQVIPEWSDDIKPGLIKTGKKYGFSDEELGNVIDHRIIHLLHEHSKLLEAQKETVTKKEVSLKKIVDKPKVLKSGTRTKERPDGAAFKKLQNTGRFQDAAAVIAQRLGDL
jgi:hypothetical protein